MFAGDDPVPRQNLREEFVQNFFAAFQNIGLGLVVHDVAMNIAIARVAETGERDAMFPLQRGGEAE